MNPLLEIIDPELGEKFLHYKTSGAIFQLKGLNKLKDYVVVPILKQGNKDLRMTIRPELFDENYEWLPDFKMSDLKLIYCKEGGRDGYLMTDPKTKDHFCSECGSAPFEDFLQAIEGLNGENIEGFTLEKAKDYKYYFKVPGGDTRKFYTWHTPSEIMSKSSLKDEFINKLVKALEVYRNAWEKKFNSGKKE